MAGKPLLWVVAPSASGQTLYYQNDSFIGESSRFREFNVRSILHCTGSWLCKALGKIARFQAQIAVHYCREKSGDEIASETR